MQEWPCLLRKCVETKKTKSLREMTVRFKIREMADLNYKILLSQLAPRFRVLFEDACQTGLFKNVFVINRVDRYLWVKRAPSFKERI